MTHTVRDAQLSFPSAVPETRRATLLASWLTLTRQTLPAMADDHRWPIRLDHCFMRVCLDAAMGRRWDEVVQRPAIRHLTEAELERAVAVAQSVVLDPGRLPELNALSLKLRGLPP